MVGDDRVRAGKTKAKVGQRRALLSDAGPSCGWSHTTKSQRRWLCLTPVGTGECYTNKKCHLCHAPHPHKRGHRLEVGSKSVTERSWESSEQSSSRTAEGHPAVWGCSMFMKKLLPAGLL